MKSFAFFGVVAVFAVLAGCAATPVPAINGGRLTSLRSSKIAVSYVFAKKDYNYYEVMSSLKPNGNFDSAWPTADKDVTADLTADLKKEGFDARSVHDISPALIEAENKDWSEKCLTESVDTNPMSIDKMPGLHRELPLPQFFQDAPDSQSFRALADALKSNGYKYLFQVTAMDLNGKALGYGMVSVSTTPNVRIIDLISGQVIWSKFFYQSDLQQLGGDLSKLMTNGMEKTKVGVANGLAKRNFASMLGI